MGTYRRKSETQRKHREGLPIGRRAEVDHAFTRGVGVRAVAEAFGYTADELPSIPAEANMGLSCGNPPATANLTPGEVVVDLGSGGGLDVFLAAEKVGPTGKAIGRAGFADVMVVDAGADLNAYTKVGGQSGCCSPAASSPVSPATSASSCCGPKSSAAGTQTVHGRLSGLLARYEVNEYAASVKLYAVKPIS
jgi:hypothetical protein